MKKIAVIIYLSLFVFFISTNITLAQEDLTTYYFIRHAEKDRSDPTNKNPGLSAKGMQRAQQWAFIFEDINIDAVYSTDYNRTLQTAMPTAQSRDLEVLKYDPHTLYTDTFKEATHGMSVLVVGHSNTTPAFVNAVLKEKRFENMDDSNNGSLYILAIIGDTKNVQLLYFN